MARSPRFLAHWFLGIASMEGFNEGEIGMSRGIK
jgi:hypothetical protein